MLDLSSVFQSQEIFEKQRSSIAEKYKFMQKKFQGFQNYKAHLFILSKLEPSYIIATPKVNLTKQEFQELSLVPQIRKICIQKIHYLSEIQYQFDIFKNKFISFNWQGKQIKQQLQLIYKNTYSNVFELFDAICHVYQYQKNKISVSLTQPVFDHIYGVFSKYSMILNQNLFEMLIFNYDITSLINSVSQFNTSLQTSLRKQFNDKCLNYNDTKKKQSTAKDVFISLAPALIARKQITINHNFMFSSDIGSFDDLHNNLSSAIKSEQNFMNNFLKIT